MDIVNFYFYFYFYFLFLFFIYKGYNQGCVCGNQYSGSYCEEMTTDIPLDKHQTGSVTQNAWNYYHLTGKTFFFRNFFFSKFFFSSF